MTDDDFAFGNIRAKGTSLGLWDYIEDITARSEDRVYFQAETEMHYRLKGSHLFQRAPVTAEHKKWIRNVFMVPASAVFYSYRETRRPSLQVTLYEKNGSCYGEMDIDLSSPLMDVWGFIVHAIEVLIPGPTNHKKLRAKMMKDPDMRKHFV